MFRLNGVYLQAITLYKIKSLLHVALSFGLIKTLTNSCVDGD
jgi:hypothetical protein